VRGWGETLDFEGVLATESLMESSICGCTPKAGTYLERMILKLSCPDRPGLVATLANFISVSGGNILEMSQFTDPIDEWFFIRIHIDVGDSDDKQRSMVNTFESLGRSINASWEFRTPGEKTRTAILVTKAAHCLQDLLARTYSGDLQLEVPIILGNRTDLEPIADRYGIPFRHIPVDKGNKEASFETYQEVIDDSGANLLILARFMQILPPAFCETFRGRAINIHHSFLPAFIGANPYKQAFQRGVKIIGATAHYVTSDLDAGPIIDQEVARVEHFHTPEDLVRLGRDCECLALSRAVRYHSDDRVIIHGNKTIVFRD
jgi:formyltetrahydrofolate deformylase